MKIKERLIISNLAIILIPIFITICSSLFIMLILTKVFNADISYESFKKLSQIQYEIFNVDESKALHSPEMFMDENYQQYITEKLTKMNADMVVLKGQKTLFTTKKLNLLDIEKCLNNQKKSLFNNTINLAGLQSVVKVISIDYKDGQAGNIILFSKVNEGWFDVQIFLWINLFVFIIALIITNIIISVSISKRILNPINQLKQATFKISEGELEFDIVENGDEEIAQLCSSFEQMRLRLKESVHTQQKYDNNRKSLLSNISHDLKTPIASIMGYVEGILDGVANEPDKIQKYLKTIYSKATLMDKMIDDLFLYSKLDLSKVPFNMEKTDIIAFFEDCMRDVETELEKSNIIIDIDNQLKEQHFVNIDRDRFKRVIINIIDNSKKYIDKEKGKIEIILRETHCSIVIEISDNGIGISKEDLPHIFDRFYRADNSRSQVKGTGLGLAISKQIVERHNGKIWARSRSNEGTSIMISINKIDY